MFDFCVGNPAYQSDMQDTSDSPIYNHFMDAAYSIADRVEMITPARFLFNAGKTPKAWNEKMLADSHFKVLMYEPDAEKVFSGIGFKGGVAIHYRDANEEFGAIGVFTSDPMKNNLFKKVIATPGFVSLSEFVYAPESYKFSKRLYEVHPEIREMKTILKGKEVPLISKGHDYDMTTNIFDKLGGIVFFEEKPDNEHEYVAIAGRKDNSRCSMWIERQFISSHPNLDSYKLLFPKANGAGKYGEVITLPEISRPGEGHTQTFISIGKMNTLFEAEAEYKYVQTKFVRALLGILKVTQDNKKSVWKYVPLQNFSEASDIDWTGSIADIDQQLYEKYSFSREEVEFIETNVKEMS